MTTQTFSATVDFATLTMLGATETTGTVTFTPRIGGGLTWTTDGERLAFPESDTREVTKAGGSQTFILAHPEGWLVPFGWEVTIKAGGRTVLASKLINIPEPGAVKSLPRLLDIPVFPPPGTPLVTLQVPATVTDGSVLVKDGATIKGIPADQFGGGREASFAQSGTLRGVFVSPGDTIPVGTPPWTLVVEVG